jgi:hypothetical protein
VYIFQLHFHGYCLISFGAGELPAEHCHILWRISCGDLSDRDAANLRSLHKGQPDSIDHSAMDTFSPKRL